jgi:hypothetical protein
MGNFEHDTNPIEKTEVVVYSTGTNLHIDPVAVALGEGNVAGINAPINAPNNGMNNQAVTAQVNTIRVQNSEVMNMLRTQHKVLQEELKQLNELLRGLPIDLHKFLVFFLLGGNQWRLMQLWLMMMMVSMVQLLVVQLESIRLSMLFLLPAVHEISTHCGRNTSSD